MHYRDHQETPGPLAFWGMERMGRKGTEEILDSKGHLGQRELGRKDKREKVDLKASKDLQDLTPAVVDLFIYAGDEQTVLQHQEHSLSMQEGLEGVPSIIVEGDQTNYVYRMTLII